MPGDADLELGLRSLGAGAYAVELRFLPPSGEAEAQLIGPPAPRVQLDPAALPVSGPAVDPAAYGAALSALLFADPRLRQGLAAARAVAAGAGVPLRVRLRLDAGAPGLHAMAWETLQEPITPNENETAPPAPIQRGVPEGRFLFTNETVLVSRYLDSADLMGVERRPRGDLRALIAIANPTDLASFRLAPIDATAELERLRTALGGVRTTVLGLAVGGPAATLANLTAALRDGPDVLCLVCHGTLLRDSSGGPGEPYLWLEREDGTSERAAGALLARSLQDLPRRPVLALLAACQGAGEPHQEGALAAVGPALAAAGVGAVVAMQGPLTQATATRLLPVFFAELLRDGRVDRALAAARAAVRERPDWWAPVLFLRLRDGRLWAASPSRPPPTLTDERARRNRQRMLARVRETWVEGVLEASLRGAPLLALGLQSRPDAVPDPWAGAAHEAPESPPAPRLFPPGTSVLEVFDHYDGELLLLGEAGAGKTTLLLALAGELLTRAGLDETLPIPVVLPLSTWAERRLPLEQWLVEELVERYDVPRAVAASWVADELVLPLLDGLDEVEAGQREGCVEAINTFCDSRRAGLVSLAVCCRTSDYQHLTSPLRLRGAVLLQPLSPAQIDAYAGSGGPAQDSLRVALEGDPELRELATTPLLLRLLTLTYRDSPTPGLSGGSPESRRAALLEAYVRRMFARRANDPRFPQESTVRWLSWLAGAMSHHSQTVFYLDRLQPDWLATPAARWRYALLDRLASGFGLGALMGAVGALAGAFPDPSPPVLAAAGSRGPLFDALLYGLPAAAVAGLFGEEWVRGAPGRVTRPPFWHVVGRGILGWLCVGLIAGTALGLATASTAGRVNTEIEQLLAQSGVPPEVAAGLMGGAGGAVLLGLGSSIFFGLAGGLAGGLTGGPGVRPRRTAVVETLRWSPSRAARAAAGGAVAGSLVGGAISLLMALVFGVVIALNLGRPEGVLVGAVAGAIGAPFLGAFGGLHFGILFGAVGGLVSGELRERSVPNQGIRRSARTAVRVGLGTGVLYVLAVSAFTGTMGSVLAATLGWSVDWRPGLPGLVLGTIPGGLLYTLIGGLAYGGYACLSHAALRLRLWRAGSLPLDAVRFLDHATERAFLRKAGGGYLFVHRSLQEHFAALGSGRPPEGLSSDGE